jgi:nicotinamidase-related amidase
MAGNSSNHGDRRFMGDEMQDDAKQFSHGTALIVVDMQEYFCTASSTLGRMITAVAADGADWYFDRVASIVVPNIARVIETFRMAGLSVVFTEFGSRQTDGSDLPLWARRHNAIAVDLIGAPCYPPLTDPSARVLPALAPRDGELVVQKTTSGPLAGTDIDRRLRGLGVEHVLVTGVATNVCVTGMVRELADADFDAYVVTDACATPGRETHEAAVASLGGTFATLVDTNEAIDLIGLSAELRRGIPID